eukprot:403351870
MAEDQDQLVQFDDLYDDHYSSQQNHNKHSFSSSLSSHEKEDSYGQGFSEGRITKLRELITFQAKENSVFAYSQINFYEGLLETLNQIMPKFLLTQSKILKVGKQMELIREQVKDIKDKLENQDKMKNAQEMIEMQQLLQKVSNNYKLLCTLLRNKSSTVQKDRGDTDEKAKSLKQSIDF